LISETKMLTVRTQIKEILKDSELGVDNISGDFIDRLDEKVKDLIVDAAKRAKENGRRTIMGKDV
jgi:histone H3/H4